MSTTRPAETTIRPSALLESSEAPTVEDRKELEELLRRLTAKNDAPVLLKRKYAQALREQGAPD
jgi:hypothetical protein